MSIVKVNNTTDSISPVGVSSLGTVVFDNIFFPSGDWTDLSGNLQAYGEVNLDSVTVTVNRQKIIQKSRVAGKDGEIKEYISNSDYMIDISAVLAPDTVNAAVISPNNPDVLLYALARLEEVPERVPIRSKFLQNNYKITYVVIKSMNISKLTADSWSLTMRLLDDTKIDLNDFG